jgi:hypothetical protein
LISINLYDSFDKVIKEIKFEVNYCYNNVYIGKENSKSGYNFELDFKNANDLKYIIITFNLTHLIVLIQMTGKKLLCSIIIAYLYMLIPMKLK